ncbi:MAG: TRAP transporter large permease subunit, partial [Nitratireductor sp.]
MDVGLISIVLVFGLVVLLGIGMPLGFASAVLAAVVMIMKFEPTLFTDPLSFGTGMLTSNPGTGALYLLTQKVYDLMTEYVLISVPLFIFMAALLERSGVAKQMYDSLDFWLSRVRGGIAIITSLMAVLMAAMSGIIGGEVVLLGLIALPQMLRLGYNQNLAIGTICASGSLGTMIPPSIVLIIYGLITETSIKALFTGAFLPGFMLASFIILYIIIRTQLDPTQAPLPEPREGDPEGFEKLKLFSGFVSIFVIGVTLAMLVRVIFLTLTGRNDPSIENFEEPAYGMLHHAPYLLGIIGVALAFIFLVIGVQRAKKGWVHGKGLVPPLLVIGIVLGSIYGGITGITEAAGMGALAVFLIALFKGEASVDLVWVSMMRTLRSTGTIIWVTVGAAALAGAYTLAGGPAYIAQLIVGADL